MQQQYSEFDLEAYLLNDFGDSRNKNAPLMNIFLFDRKYYEKLIAHNRIDHRAAGFLDEYESILRNIKYGDLSHRKEKQRTVIQEYINTKRKEKKNPLEDLNRIRSNISIYRQRIFEYPQGSLMTRNINGRDYIYLKYRKDRKVIQEYVSPFSQNIYNELKSKIDQRKILQNELKSLIAEERDMVKALKALGEKNV